MYVYLTKRRGPLGSGFVQPNQRLRVFVLFLLRLHWTPLSFTRDLYWWRDFVTDIRPRHPVHEELHCFCSPFSHRSDSRGNPEHPDAGRRPQPPVRWAKAGSWRICSVSGSSWFLAVSQPPSQRERNCSAVSVIRRTEQRRIN